jgi:hypothetical protein
MRPILVFTLGALGDHFWQRRVGPLHSRARDSPKKRSADFEARISMEKERLTISAAKVTVEYELLNESSRDIATELAFPVAPNN